jgi:uncharacterized protein YgbK (DUF1537 family)
VIRWLIADDLTGAADASVHFAARREATIVFDRRELEGLVAIDTETRSLAPAEAALVLTELAAGMIGAVFKKVDSTLRGPVAAELEALRVALGRRAVVLAPSLPAQGRIVAGGRLVVAGQDRGPVRDLAGIDAVDAATDEDLDRVAAACAADPTLLPAGSAGLAAAFARLEGPALPVPSPPPAGSVLVVVGSPHPVAREQARVLAAGLPARVELCESIPSGVLRLQTAPPAMAILATGGDTARAICRELGITSLRVRGELLPGVVWTEAGGRVLVTKSGGFGAPNHLLLAALKLSRAPGGGSP